MQTKNPFPVDSSIPELATALATQRRVVLQAPPGAGKTTRVPPALLDADWLAGQRILMLEPRRLAARAAAAFMARQYGEEPGGKVGYQVRFENRISAATRIEVVTEGILARRLQSDPELTGVGLVIFDEFHERHLHSDLALALCLEVQASLRPDLRLLIMSATLDGEGIGQRLDAPLVKSEGRAWPVDLHYLPAEPVGPLWETAATAVRRALAEQATGDLLLFLPGSGEIRRATDRLKADLPPDVELHPLFGDMPLAAQAAAIEPAPAGRRKVVLATNIAESSLTIEGVRVVVDCGWAREPRFDPRTGMTRLETVRISRASADQRAGRAGRLGPGVCYRLWSEATQRGLIPFGRPEIASADLAPLALELAQWGARESDLIWMDPPPAGAMAQGRELLQSLGAIDHNDRITPVGQRMARLPLHPRLSHLIGAAEPEETGLACDLAALLSERDILRQARECDFEQRVSALLAFRRDGRRGADAYGADSGACRQVEQAARQWRRLAGADKGDRPDPGATGRLLALAYPDRIAQRRDDDPGRYRLANGRGARLDGACPLAGRPYLVAVALDDAGQDARIQAAAAIEATDVEALYGDRIETFEEVRWDEAVGRVVARRVRRFGQLELDSERLADADPERIVDAVLAAIRAAGLESLPWSDEARTLQARIGLLRAHLGDPWPDLSDETLAASLEQWLRPHLYGVRSRQELARLNLAEALRATLEWPLPQQLDEQAPLRIRVPSGHDRPIRYRNGEPPALAVKLQELFGLADTPRIAGGRVPLTVELLSPAGRPVQITTDLASFWSNTYPEVKKELKGRYPKHPWPDDPWNAPATARTTRAMKRHGPNESR